MASSETDDGSSSVRSLFSWHRSNFFVQKRREERRREEKRREEKEMFLFIRRNGTSFIRRKVRRRMIEMRNDDKKENKKGQPRPITMSMNEIHISLVNDKSSSISSCFHRCRLVSRSLPVLPLRDCSSDGDDEYSSSSCLSSDTFKLAHEKKNLFSSTIFTDVVSPGRALE